MTMRRTDASSEADRWDSGQGRRLAVGFLVQGGGFVLLLLLQILLVPVFLSMWDRPVYGGWLVIYAGCGLLFLADLGMHGCTTVALRLSWARGDAAGFLRLLHSGLGVYAALTVMWTVGLLLVAAAADVPALLGVTHVESATEVMVLLGLSTIWTLPRGIVSSVYSARGEYGREAGLALFFYAGGGLAQAAVVMAGGTPLQVAWAHAVVSLLLGWGPLLLDLRRHHPDVPLRVVRPTWAELRMFAVRAPYYAVSAAAAAAVMHVPVLVLGQLASDHVVTFTTMRTFTGLTRQAARHVSDLTGMEMARLHTQEQREALWRLYADTAQLAGGLVGLLTGVSMVLGPDIFAVWTRGALTFDPGLAAGFFAMVLLMAPGFGASGLLRCVDHPKVMAAGFAIQAVSGVLLCPLLVVWLDALGAALAMGVAEALALGIYMWWASGHLLAVRTLPIVGRSYLTALLGCACGAGAGIVAEWLVHPGTMTGLLTFGMLWCALVAVPMLFLLLDDRRRAGLSTWLRGRCARAAPMAGPGDGR